MILVDVYAPAVDQTYDFLLDENADLSAIVLELTEMIARKTGSEKPGNAGDFVMYHAGMESPLSMSKTLFENGVRDGDRLILV